MATVETGAKRARFTDKSVAKMVASNLKRCERTDPGTPGLSLRMGPNGRAAWYALYTVAGAGPEGRRSEQRRFKLGNYPLIDLPEARTRVRDVLDKADRGFDPRDQRQKQIDELRERKFETVLDRYVRLWVKEKTRDGRFARAQEERAKKEAERTGEEPRDVGRCPAERLLADHVGPKWNGRDLDAVRMVDVDLLLDDIITDAGMPIAREVRKHLTGFFSWAARRGIISVSPMAGLRRPDLAYTARKRWLTMDEVRRVWDAAGDLGYPFGDMYRLLMLTGNRKNEIATLRRSSFDSDVPDLLVIAAENVKGGEMELSVPLSPQAKRLIESLPRWNDGDYLFSTTGGRRPISGFSKAEERLYKKVAERTKKEGLEPMEDFVPHDFRRTINSHMSRLGVRPDIVERVLGHKLKGIEGVYGRYDFLKERREALARWGAEVDRCLKK